MSVVGGKRVRGKKSLRFGEEEVLREEESGGKRVPSLGGKRSVSFSGGKRVLLYWREMALLGKRDRSEKI